MQWISSVKSNWTHLVTLAEYFLACGEIGGNSGDNVSRVDNVRFAILPVALHLQLDVPSVCNVLEGDVPSEDAFRLDLEVMAVLYLAVECGVYFQVLSNEGENLFALWVHEFSAVTVAIDLATTLQNRCTICVPEDIFFVMLRVHIGSYIQ